jgi:predicted glycoside hydrolase/deacetylase ChbG (UPF0249 family)
MKFLIVNADDFNLTPGVRQGIIKAFQEGIVRSTTVMINLPELDLALALLKQNPDLGVGLHGNLTYGKPVLPAAKVLSLLDAEGNFYRKPSLVLEHAAWEEAEAELEAQIRLALSCGIKLSHLDSHHHLHSYPPFDKIFIKLAQKYHLPLRTINDDLRRLCREAAIPTPDYFTEEFYGAEKVKVENLLTILHSLAAGCTEVCCHPALVDEQLIQISSYSHPREKELEVLTSADLKAALDKQGIKLINYRQLKKSSYFSKPLGRRSLSAG